MSIKKPYNRKKGRQEKFVAIYDWMTKTPAWAHSSCYARALLIEIVRKFNGSNNGEIFLSHRDAASLLNVSRPTAKKAFVELEEKGFIVCTVPHHLGSEGRGLAAKYRLTHQTYKNQTPTKEFTKWKPSNSEPP